MSRMNPTGDPQAALAEALYVDHPDQRVWSALQHRLELDPAAAHLVLGGIGSGKTSELLRLHAALHPTVSTVGDHVEYCDVSRYHDLTTPHHQGVLITLIAKRLLRAAPRMPARPSKELAEAVASLNRLADGFMEWVDSREYEYEHEHEHEHEHEFEHEHHLIAKYTRGVLNPPQKDTVPWANREYISALRQLRNYYPGPHKQVLFLLDSLDRLPNAADFIALARDDIRTLKTANIGVVVVGPIRYMVGNDRALADLFDETHFQRSIDAEGNIGGTFLKEVLRRRDGEHGLLPDDVLEPLARASGGVLRDLIKLAKRAAEEAYSSGREYVTLPDVTRASDAEGRSLAVGLDDEQLKVLRKVRETQRLVIRGERELGLLETRRILMYDDRWIVHPSLEPLLDLMPSPPIDEA